MKVIALEKHLDTSEVIQAQLSLSPQGAFGVLR